jgi:N-ethylmaleimide reductase
VRLSPSGWSSDFTENTPRATYAYVVGELDRLAIGSLEIREGDDDDNASGGPQIPISFFRPLYRGVLVANTSFTHAKAGEYLARGDCDAVAFGKPFISNPDLAARFERGVALAEWDAGSFYPSSASVPMERGYTDYPRAT